MSTVPIKRSFSSRRAFPTTTYSTTGNRITVGNSRIVSGRQTSARRISPTVTTSKWNKLRSSRVVSRGVVGEPMSTTVRAAPTLRKSIVTVDRVQRPVSSRLTKSRYMVPTTSTQVNRVVTTSAIPSTSKVTNRASTMLNSTLV